MANNARAIKARGFRGSQSVIEPEGIVEGTLGSDGDAGRLNGDYYANSKAQGWWALRKRFQKTYRWVQYIKTEGKEGAIGKPDECINLRKSNPNVMKLVAELTQITYRQNEVGKIVIEKKPGGMKSPNMADTVMIYYAPKENEPIEITGDMLRQIAMAGAPARRR